MLFRGGTYLTVPAPPPAVGVAAPPNAPPPPLAVPTSTTPTPTVATTPPAGAPLPPTPQRAGTPLPSPSPRAAADVYHAALLAAETTTPSATLRPTTAVGDGQAERLANRGALAVDHTRRHRQPSDADADTRDPRQPDAASTPTANTRATATPTSAASPTPTPGLTQPADYVASPLERDPRLAANRDWQDGIIDGVYGGSYGVFLIRGGEYVQLGFGHRRRLDEPCL